MKGSIVNCLEEMITEKYGKEKWQQILKISNCNQTIFMATSDVDDKLVMSLIDSTCKALGISLQQAFDAFGEYFICNFTAKKYSGYYEHFSSAKSFLLSLEEIIHFDVRKNIRNATPPKFEYKRIDEKTLIMKYISKRNLIDLAISLIKGVGKYYKEDLKVKKISNDEIEIIFP